ncbi:hypothetical protein SAM19_04005 [Brevibacillus laterosporus]|nr:hypothetical protein [Brevibacillus laterosporus]
MLFCKTCFYEKLVEINQANESQNNAMPSVKGESDENGDILCDRYMLI